MEKTDKPLTRDALVSMQVIDAKGRLMGKVKDVAFAVGKMGIALTVENEDGRNNKRRMGRCSSSLRLHTSKAPGCSANRISTCSATTAQTMAQPAQQSTQPLCPTCGKPLTWIPQYQRWYCYNDKKYV